MARYKDLTGQVFGKLTVREYAGSNNHGAALWLCDCKCGGTKIVSANNLKNGYTKSCGCLPSYVGIDITGKKYGKLTAIRSTNQRDGHSSVVWECKCDCGKSMVYVSANNLISGSVTSCRVQKNSGWEKNAAKSDGSRKEKPEVWTV